MAAILLQPQCVNGKWFFLGISRGPFHYTDVIMGMRASQITSLAVVYSTVYSGADQRKYQSFASLAFVRRPVNSPHKWPVTRKMFPFDDLIMYKHGWALIPEHISTSVQWNNLYSFPNFNVQSLKFGNRHVIPYLTGHVFINPCFD